MSSSRIHEIACQYCDTINNVKVWDSVNVTVDPELKKQVFDGTLSGFTCSNCGKKTRVVHDYLYHDMDKQFMIYLVHKENQKATMNQVDLLQKLMFSSKTLRTVENQLQLIEKINIFENGLDDYVIEFLKINYIDYLAEHLEGDPLVSISNKMLFTKLDAEDGGPKDDLVFVLFNRSNGKTFFKVPNTQYSTRAEAIKLIDDGFFEKIKADNQMVNSKYVHDIVSSKVFCGKPYQQWQDMMTVKKETLNLPDGSIYIGDCFNGKPHGKGTLTNPDGGKYVGEFREGRIYGQGTMIEVGEWSLTGFWQNGKLNGEGFYKTVDGDEYQGSFVNGKFHGYGIFKYSNGSIYAGNWDMGEKHGHGILTKPGGYKYDGTWHNGEPGSGEKQPKSDLTIEQVEVHRRKTREIMIREEMRRSNCSYEEASQIIDEFPFL